MRTYADILNQVRSERGGLVEALQAVQERDGYLSKEALRVVADFFELPVSKVFETASFYSYLSLKPKGRHTVRICESAPCHVAGASAVVSALEQLLGVKTGETTPDGRFTLSYTGCVGQCQAGPVITIDRDPHTEVTADILPALLAAYE
jgi:NADH-quinone oxidoreductase subunit E